jgi:hypothetical protein
MAIINQTIFDKISEEYVVSKGGLLVRLKVGFHTNAAKADPRFWEHMLTITTKNGDNVFTFQNSNPDMVRRIGELIADCGKKWAKK